MERMNNMERNTETLSNTRAEEVPDLVKPAADSHPACPMDTQTQNTGCRDDAVRDDRGNATALGTDTESQSVNDKVGVTTSHQTPPIVESEEEKTRYHSTLHQMQQQQKLKSGRRFKKKTLMKMAKLFVIAKEWDSEIIETSEVKYSNGPLSEPEPSVLNQKEETFTSSVTSHSNTIITKSPEVGRSDCDKETFFPAVSADVTFSGQTAAPQVTLKKKRGTPSTSKKQAKEACSTSTNLLDVPDLNREVSERSRLITAPKVQRTARKVSSVTFKEDTKITCDNSEIAINSPAAISSVDLSKTQTSKRRKKSPTSSVKKRTKQKHLPQTLTDCNAMMPQGVSEGFLVSDVTQKDENEALCTTAAKIHSKDPPGTKLKKKAGRTFRKKALMSKDKQFVQDVEIIRDNKKSDTCKEDDLSYQQTSLSQVSSRGKKRKKEVMSKASKRKSTERQRSKLKSAETTDVTPESIIKTEDSAGVSPNDEVSFQVEHWDCGVPNAAVKTRHPKTLKKVRKKRIHTSRPKCKKGQQAVQLLSADDISLQKQNETALEKEITDISTSQLQNPQKHTANNKKYKAEPVNVPVSEPAMIQCAAAEFLMQMSDIKTEPACEPVTLPLTKKKSRQQKRPVQRAKNTITLNAPNKEESDYFDIQGDTFGQEQQLNEETTRGINPEKPRKGQRKLKKVEDEASEQTMNPDLNIKCEVHTLNQLDSPPIHIKKESDERHISPIKTQPCRKRKLPSEYRDNTKKPTKLISVCGSEGELLCGDKINNNAEEDVENSGSSVTGKALDTAHKWLKQAGRRKKVKPEPDNTFLENQQRNETKCKRLKQRKVTSSSLGVNDVIQGVTAQPEEILISYLKDIKRSQVSKCRRTRAVKKEPVVDEAVVKNGNMLDEVLNVQDNVTNPPKENPQDVKITGNQEETVNVPKEEQLMSDRIEAANPENMKKFKGKKKHVVGRRRLKVAALVEENVKVTGEVQSVEYGLTSPSLHENVPENIKAKRKREGKIEKQRLVSDHSGEGFNIVPNPANASLNKNIQEKVKEKGKRSKRVKPELCTVEDNKDVKLEPEDKIFASFRGQTKESPEITETGSSEKSLRGNQRVSRKRKTKSSAAVLLEDTSQMEDVVSDLKNALKVSFEFECEAPKSELTGRENIRSKVTTKHKFGQTAKKKALMGLPNQKSSEQPESDTRVPVNQEICSKPKMTCKGGKGKAPARSGKASKAVKMEDTVSSIHHTANTDLYAVKQEHDESKISELTSEAASPFQDEISPTESAVSAGNTKMKTTRKRRRNKTVWYPKKKLKQHQIHASFESSMSPFSFYPCNSLTDDEMIDLKLKDENDDVTQRNTVQPLSSDQAEETTANTRAKRSSKLKNYDPLPQKLKPQKPLKCFFCGRSFRHISAFTVHKRIHTGEKPYRCTTCGKRFAHISRLNLHTKIHTESPAVCCPCCDQKFKSKDELIVHFVIHVKDIKSSNVTAEDAHNQQVDDCLNSPVTSSHNKPFRCSICCKEFISRATFKMHGRTHGGKPHTCSVCGKKFCKPSSLNVHEKTHWPVKPYSCSVCCTGFVKLQELKRHSEMHSGVTPFSCARCEKAFGSFALLRSHQVSEVCSEERDSSEGNQVDIEGFLFSQGVEGQIVTPVYFKCPICKQIHRHWCQHVLHLQTHHQSKSYTCETCGQEYEHASDMRSHCSVCCRASGEERACRSSLSEIWKEPEAPKNQASEPPHVDQEDQMSFSPQVETGEERACGSSLSEIWKEPEASQNQASEPPHEDQKSQTSFSPQVETGEERACGPSLSEICEELEAPQNQGSEPSHEDQKSQMSFPAQVDTGEERACGSSLSEIWKEPEDPQNQASEPPHEDQKSQTSFSPQVETDEKEVTDMQSPPPSPSNSSPSVNDDFDISVPSPNPGGKFSDAGNDQTTRQPSRFHPQSLIRRHCGRYSCGHCGKSFNRWNKLWLHRRSHRRTVRPFCCSQCDLEFRFLGSYIDHLREHAAQMPYACPLCPDTFSSDENLSAHIFECHKQDDGMKCSTCGKSFSSLRHLKKHKLLHKGVGSHFCLPCNTSFPHISALKTHLKTHRTRLNVPQPAGLVEPFLFPYHCRKCTAKFSSTDLLQAHQVCHFTVGEKPGNLPESVASCIPSRAQEDMRQQRDVSEPSQRTRRLPVSNKKHLFRYPHPDRLYVVPVVSSEPPVVISDTEEEQSPSITASDTMSSASPQGQPAPNTSNIPQSSAVSKLGDMDEHQTGSSHQQLQDQYQDALKDITDIGGCDSDSAELEPVCMILKENESVDDAHNCAICTETFTDISKLHEHYIDHAKGM
ncbi:uncharacterized protein LOC121913799 [Thunnus maccoyii]|uniref:uncharacterized protein LOC121913799 n=1 Tax=Thunnus maccoyii TaxID=8240 RepID=UPI001C4BF9B5|nr:uncharacterized protein LOC121913799 [Thunnus maccoyii]